MLIDKLRKALNKDFEELYVKEFTADWEIQRLLRSIEINLMSFDNLRQLIYSSEIKKRKEIASAYRKAKGLL